jgi:hypothetical protein
MRKLVTLGLAALAMACASSGSSDTASPSGTAAPRRAASGGRNVLTQQEVKEKAADITNVYDAIERLRPDFLRARAATTMGTGGSDASGITAYVNMDRQPNLESLRAISVAELREVRRLSASEAQSKFGLNNMAGAIQVVTNRAP